MSRRPAAVPYARLAAALLPLAAACSSSVTDLGNEGARALTADEATLAESAVRLEAYNARGATSVHTTPGAAPQTFTGACPLGGSVVAALAAGRTIDAAGAEIATFTTTVTPRACVVSAGSRNVTVDGDSALVTTVTIPVVDGILSSTAPAVTRTAGGLKIDGASCAVDYTATTTPGGSFTIGGTICGYPVR